MGYYGLILLSVVMFGGGFALTDIYRKMRGSSLCVSMEAAFIGAFAGLAVLLLINGFAWEFTPFTLLMALLAALNSIAFTFFSFRALDKINLSLFSLFSMLGGMALPFFQGILFFGEGLTVAKIVCTVFICAALLLTVTRGESRGGWLWYAGIFVLNGMSGVISKLFTSASFEKTSAEGYSIWCAICTLIVAGAAWIFLVRRKRGSRAAYTPAAFGVCALQGGISRIANYLLVIALLHVDASVQYPMVTGGVMIVSTLIALFGEKKPTVKEMLSVAVAFLGMLALFIIPI